MKTEEIKSSILLFLAAFIWGIAFVAQSVGMDYVGPMTFNGSRFLLGGTVLLPFIYYRKKKGQEKRINVFAQAEKGKKNTLIGGGLCGLAICLSSCLQQYGLQYTTVGKAGFITALYIVIVPIWGVFLGKKIGIPVWIGTLLATAGLYLLCITENVPIGRGDLLVFLCALTFSGHIMLIDHFAPKVDGVKLSCIQFYVSGIICTILALFIEQPEWSDILAGAVPILYTGILSCGVAYTLQIIGQAKLSTTTASMILSLEAVISVLAGWLILKERMTERQIWGCILVFLAVLLAQAPFPEKKGKGTG